MRLGRVVEKKWESLAVECEMVLSLQPLWKTVQESKTQSSLRLPLLTYSGEVKIYL